MYGLVNRALQEFICQHHGDASWQAIKTMASVDVELFVRMESYPDDITYRLVGAACESLNIAPATLLRNFGRHWVLFTGQEGYGSLLDGAGSSLQEILSNLDDLHVRVGLMYPALKPPSFSCANVSDDGLTLHYFSERPGLAPMVIGLIEGLGERLGKSLTISQTSDRNTGADHDSFDIRIA
ncbi:heme NO-binding domain-containing protein [Dechloromonas sp. ARDL1]|uniref:heme NO-binding domain-containing protein n=1 Tax=Dechloromonas sp. ARDL1 TaxID=3322121 RepID=UPI003DA7224F